MVEPKVDAMVALRADWLERLWVEKKVVMTVSMMAELMGDLSVVERAETSADKTVWNSVELLAKTSAAKTAVSRADLLVDTLVAALVDSMVA